MSLMKSYWMQQNDKVTVFTVSELLRLNNRDDIYTIRIRVKAKETDYMWI